MRQCIFVIGTRAQLVKVAPVLQLAVELQLQHSVWFTGQHHESIADLIADFGLTSSFVLPEQLRERSSVGKLLLWTPNTAYRCFEYVSKVRSMTKKRPLVIVHGDTLSTWLGALAGTWAGGHIVHLESGLSSGKWSDPFPEELLRRLTFRKVRYAICPNNDAAKRMSGFPGCIVVNTHENTLLDCVRFATAGRVEKLAEHADFVVSIHRFQNIYKKESLQRIVGEIISIAECGSVWFILHPPTEIRLRKYGLFERLRDTPGVKLQPRMPYTEFLALLGHARAVFSDGGSNQEELSYLGVPTVLYRKRSERPDGLGANIVLRNELSRSLVANLHSGKIDKLRVPPRIDDTVYPSRITVESLLDWA